MEDEPHMGIRYDYAPDTYHSAVLQIPAPKLPKELIAAAVSLGFEPKGEHHVTLLPSELFNNQSREASDRLSRAIREAILSVGVDDIGIGPTAYIVNRPKVVQQLDGSISSFPRESIVVPLNPDSIFVQRVNQAYRDNGYTSDDYPFCILQYLLDRSETRLHKLVLG